MTVEEMEQRMSSQEFADWLDWFPWYKHYNSPEG